MPVELLAALCLVAVIEGLFLFVAPRGWKRMAEQMHAMPDRGLRVIGAAVMLAGLGALMLVRGASA